MQRNLRFLLPSFADIFFLCPFLFLSLSSGHNLLNDLGTGFHIRAGKYILDNFSVPKYDVFTHIAPLPWVAHEWLSEVILAVVHDVSGLTGVVLFFSFLIGLTYFLLFRLVHAEGGNIVVSCFITFLAAVASTLHWLARPHVFSLVLVVVWYSVLNAYQYKTKNCLYVLPLIMLLWVNLHGGFVLGFVLLAIYLFGNAAGSFSLSASHRSLSKEKFRALTRIAFVCGLSSVANPYGWHILLFPFNTVSQQFLIDVVMEYASPNFHDQLPFKYLLFLTIGILAVSRTKPTLIELILILLFTYMALYSSRHIPLFAIVIAPIVGKYANLLLQKTGSTLIKMFNTRAANVDLLNVQLKGHAWPVLGILAVWILGQTGFIHFGFEQTSAPVAAVNFLKSETIRGNMFSSDRFGDYVIYAAWPQYKVFIDGRSDMYGSDRAKEYLTLVMIQPGWKEVMAKYDINFAFLDANSPLSLLLGQSDNWRLIYADKTANIFVRNVPANRELINKYPDVKFVL